MLYYLEVWVSMREKANRAERGCLWTSGLRVEGRYLLFYFKSSDTILYGELHKDVLLFQK